MKPKIRLPFAGKYPITFKFGEAPEWYVQIAGYPHNGVDFGCPVGTPIVACDEGIVNYADNVPDSDGLGIIISHEWGLSQYWHLSKLSVNAGDRVQKGESIGYSGATGWATGPHLHWGIKDNEVDVPEMRGWNNPINYLYEPMPEPDVPVIMPKTHLVMPGDSLWKIAEKYYNKGYYWVRIFEANKDKIKTPMLIYPFQRLRIP